MGTRTIFFPSERMMLSSLTISPRFFLMASRIFSLWRSWSTCPLRCNDQSCCETDMQNTPSLARLVQFALIGRVRGLCVLSFRYPCWPLLIQFALIGRPDRLYLFSKLPV